MACLTRRRELWNLRLLGLASAWEMMSMAIRLFKAVGLAALVVFPAHSQNLSAFDHAVAITTYLQVITEDDVDERTKLDLLLAQKQVGREGVIRELSARLPSHSQNVNKPRPEFA